MQGMNNSTLESSWGVKVYNGSELLLLPEVLSPNNTSAPQIRLSTTARVFITTSYVIGVLGNLAALYILHKERKTRYRNKKHTLMLRCLAGNDLVGLLGMLVQMLAPCSSVHLSCVFRVVWRGFGLSSGCVALVMAIERWLALTHPFRYQKSVTYNALLKAILASWTAVLILSCMPFFGFGLYFDPDSSRCKRYRDATTPVDVAYAYLFFAFGILLALSIAFANLSVTMFLCHSSPAKVEAVGRRISRTHSKTSNNHQTRMRVECLSDSTPDEVAFARLMVALSFTFLACWLPNMICIPLAQFWPKYPFSKRFFELSDVMMAIHFTLDPYVYVLLHHYFPCLKFTFDAIQKHCCWSFKKTETILGETSSCI